MMKLKKVVKIRILTTEKHRKDLIRALYSFGLVQIVSAIEPSYDKPISEYEGIAEALVYLRSVMRKYNLGIDPEPYHGDITEITGHKEEIQKMRTTLRSFESKVSKAQEDYSTASKPWALLSGFEASAKDIDAFAGKISKPNLLFASFKPSAKKSDVCGCITGAEGMLFENPRNASDSSPVAFVFPEGRRQKVLTALEGNVDIVEGPVGLGKSETFSKRLEAARASEQHSRKALDVVDNDLREHLLANKEHYLSIMSKLETLSSLATLPLKFSKSGKLLVVEGWVPEDLMIGLERKVNDNLRNVVQVTRLQTADMPPTLLNNSDVARPFEFFLRFFSVPYYEELDPTALITFTFPLFFGMILGDIGYGIVGLVIALLVRSRLKGSFFQDISRILILSSISTMFFGFLFAEFFGLENILGYELHPYVARTTTAGISFMMGVCLAVGALHLLVGYVLGLLNALAEKEYHHAAAKFCWIILELGLAATFIFGYGIVTGPVLGVPAATLGLASGILTLVSLVGVVKFEGIAGLIEVFGLISNIFSYLRLIALGISGAVLATLISGLPIDLAAIAGMFTGTHPFDLGIILNVIAFALLMIVGHAVAFFLGLFESSIQSLRLHYVEFFSKFYQGGGIDFAPLRKPVPARRGVRSAKAEG
ncbi:MAG: V-type ATPase 116kDa subunit family protein [Candidatus Micrarchaeia archaeon]